MTGPLIVLIILAMMIGGAGGVIYQFRIPIWLGKILARLGCTVVFPKPPPPFNMAPVTSALENYLRDRTPNHLQMLNAAWLDMVREIERRRDGGFYDMS